MVLLYGVQKDKTDKFQHVQIAVARLACHTHLQVWAYHSSLEITPLASNITPKRLYTFLLTFKSLINNASIYPQEHFELCSF